MMDVDDSIGGEVIQEFRAQNLHVPGKDDDVDVKVFQQFELLGLVRWQDDGRVVVVVVAHNGSHVIRNAKGFGHGTQRLVVRNDDLNVGIQLSRLVSQEQFPQAMVVFRYEDAQFLPAIPPIPECF